MKFYPLLTPTLKPDRHPACLASVNANDFHLLISRPDVLNLKVVLQLGLGVHKVSRLGDAIQVSGSQVELLWRSLLNVFIKVLSTE